MRCLPSSAPKKIRSSTSEANERREGGRIARETKREEKKLETSVRPPRLLISMCDYRVKRKHSSQPGEKKKRKKGGGVLR